jgi:hypothetical protein
MGNSNPPDLDTKKLMLESDIEEAQNTISGLERKYSQMEKIQCRDIHFQATQMAAIRAEIEQHRQLLAINRNALVRIRKIQVVRAKQETLALTVGIGDAVTRNSSVKDSRKMVKKLQKNDREQSEIDSVLDIDGDEEEDQTDRIYEQLKARQEVEAQSVIDTTPAVHKTEKFKGIDNLS